MRKIQVPCNFLLLLTVVLQSPGHLPRPHWALIALLFILSAESEESTLRKQNGNPHCLTPSQAVDHDSDFSKDKSQLLPRKMFPFNPIKINLVLE